MCVLGKVQPPLSAHLLLLLCLRFGMEARVRSKVTEGTSGPSPWWLLSTWPNSELLEGRALSLPFLSLLRQRWALMVGHRSKERTLPFVTRAWEQELRSAPLRASCVSQSKSLPSLGLVSLGPCKVLETLSSWKATSWCLLKEYTLTCAQRGTSKDGSLASNSEHCLPTCQPIEESLNKLQYTHIRCVSLGRVKKQN